MTIKRLFLLIACILTTACLLVGCGKTAPNVDEPSADPGQPLVQPARVSQAYTQMDKNVLISKLTECAVINVIERSETDSGEEQTADQGLVCVTLPNLLSLYELFSESSEAAAPESILENKDLTELPTCEVIVDAKLVQTDGTLLPADPEAVCRAALAEQADLLVKQLAEGMEEISLPSMSEADAKELESYFDEVTQR